MNENFENATIIFHHFVGHPEKNLSPEVQGVQNKKIFWDTLYSKKNFNNLDISLAKL